MSKTEPGYIIAIGASAGGMEEINSFFDHTPTDGVAYVIVQHLSPDFKSRMAELLAKHSKLVIEEAQNEMNVKCNQVYLIPNDKFMTIHDNKLLLTDKEKVQGPHLTINRFFNSLASNSGHKAIGVVLSGLGSDGTEGIKAIKREGGMVIARDPETSEFSSMPSNAIATGLVDFILEPRDMPETIEDYVKHHGEISAEDEDDEKNIAAIINLIKEQSPLDFTDYKPTTITRRIKKRAAGKNFNRLENYLHYLKTSPDEIEALTKDFLISVTSFFRDTEAFDFIAQNVIPDIIKHHNPADELKLWVAGCATGEEAYSLGILLAEQLTGTFKDTVVKIFATDIDTSALRHARNGVYKSSILKDVSAARLEKYFLKEGESYRINPEIRQMVIFAPHDLVKNPPYCNMHFISCRNLLIYMSPALQKKVFLMLLFGLRKDGYLFLGSSENPMPILQNLESINKKWKIYKNLETNRAVRFDAFSFPELIDVKQAPSTLSPETGTQKLNNILSESVNNNLAEELNALVICIDEQNHVLKSFGDTGKYLLQQNFNINLADLLPRPLAVAFNTISKSALKKNEKIISKGLTIQIGETVTKVDLSVIPLIKKGMQKMLMVIFRDSTPVNPTDNKDILFDEKIYLDRYTLNLEEELKEVKAKLHDTFEKLDASNENMQSFNEELLSANEEMQSTNEEMQSVNEELHTINSDYQLKNKELLELNDDLNNYFRSNINGQLFVNNDLILIKFSPGAVKLINLLESDVGRPLSNISTNIKFETIIDDINAVLANGNMVSKEVQTTDGKWYQMLTMPYLQLSENKTNGAIITFNDITELKKTQQQLDKKNQSLLRINADLDNFVHTASHDLLAPLGNIEVSIAVMNEMKTADPQLITFLNVINSSIKKFRLLITDISAVAKLESGLSEKEFIDLDEIITNVEWSLAEKIKLTNAVIIRDLHVKLIRFSKKNLRSIIYNLVSNAIKFRGDKPPVITICTAKEDEMIVLTVQDNGIGIDKSEHQRIFDLYRRLTADADGQGIGLYLAKKIVDAAGGNIVIESEPGKGAKFIISFKEET